LEGTGGSGRVGGGPGQGGKLETGMVVSVFSSANGVVAGELRTDDEAVVA